jgi:hypothetical protein
MDRDAGEIKRRDGYVVVDRLRLASWLCVNSQRLACRELDSLHQHVVYYFELTPEIDDLIDQWVRKRGLVNLATLARFSEAVSFEIRIAARLRRGEDTSRLQPPRHLRQITGQPERKLIS